MKILYISSSTIPSRTANSIHVMKMSQAFAQQGHQVELLAPMRHCDSMEQTEGGLWKHYGIEQIFPIRWLSEKKIFRSYDYALRAAHDAWKNKPDLVFTRNVPAAAVVAWFGIPTVCESHAPVMGSLEKWSLRCLIRASGFQKLIVISQPMKKKFSQMLGSAEHIHVLPDGVDLERFENLPAPPIARKLIGISTQKQTLGYAGHLYKGRGIELILQLAKRCPDYQFLIMGGTQEAIQHYSDFAKTQNLQNLLFLGFIKNSDLPKYLAACDLLLMPYQHKVAVGGGGDTSSWMSPLKMFEYMACQRVIISSDLPVLREILNEQNSVLCDPTNAQAWLEVIEKMTCNPQWASQIANQAKQDVQQFSWKNRVKTILSDLPVEP